MLALLLFAQATTGKPAEPVGHLREVVVDAIRNCPKPVGDEIVVCSRDRGIAEGYRIPKLDPRYATNLRPSGRGELAGAEVGATGVRSCTNVGAVGATGCTLGDYSLWGAWAREQRAARKAAEGGD